MQTHVTIVVVSHDQAAERTLKVPTSMIQQSLFKNTQYYLGDSLPLSSINLHLKVKSGAFKTLSERFELTTSSTGVETGVFYCNEGFHNYVGNAVILEMIEQLMDYYNMQNPPKKLHVDITQSSKGMCNTVMFDISEHLLPDQFAKGTGVLPLLYNKRIECVRLHFVDDELYAQDYLLWDELCTDDKPDCYLMVAYEGEVSYQTISTGVKTMKILVDRLVHYRTIYNLL